MIVPMRMAAVAVLVAAGWLQPAAAASRRDQLVAKVEQMALAMLPTNEVREAMGFFGPVTKKYLPVWERFSADYAAATSKLAVVRAYVPKAQSALAEAEKLKVPAKYQPQKEAYLEKFRLFISALNLTMLMGK